MFPAEDEDTSRPVTTSQDVKEEPDMGPRGSFSEMTMTDDQTPLPDSVLERQNSILSIPETPMSMLSGTGTGRYNETCL